MLANSRVYTSYRYLSKKFGIERFISVKIRPAFATWKPVSLRKLESFIREGEHSESSAENIVKIKRFEIARPLFQPLRRSFHFDEAYSRILAEE